MFLAEWNVDERQRLLAQVPILGVTYNTDDLDTSLFRSHLQTFADCVAAVVATRNLFVHDDNVGTAFPVLRVEISSSDERNAHRAEEVQPDNIRVGLSVFVLLWLITFKLDTAPLTASADRHDPRQRNGLHSRKTADAFERLLIKRLRLLFVEICAACFHRSDEEILSSEAGIKTHCMSQTAHKQRCADQKYKRQR